jgi:hypothetical protein
MVNDVSGEKRDGHSHVFEVIERSLEVHVLDVSPSKAFSGRADGAVPEEFGRYHIGGAHGQLEGVVNEVPYQGDADAVGIFLLRLMDDDNTSIRSCSVFGDVLYLIVRKEKDGVSGFCDARFPLGKAVELLDWFSFCVVQLCTGLFPQKKLSVIPYSTIQLVCNSSKKTYSCRH